MNYIDYAIIFGGSVVSYLAGSIPFGLIFTKLATGKDLREEGSGNIGATNATRSGGMVLGFFVFLFDGLKGLVPTVIGLYFGDMETFMFSLCAFLGHLFPIFLRFKGGKGVSTFIFIMLALNYKLAAVFIVVWFIVFSLSRYVSLASMLACLCSYLYACYLATSEDVLISIPTMLFITTAVSLIILKHMPNLHRLCEGREHRFSRKN